MRTFLLYNFYAPLGWIVGETYHFATIRCNHKNERERKKNKEQPSPPSPQPLSLLSVLKQTHTQARARRHTQYVFIDVSPGWHRKCRPYASGWYLVSIPSFAGIRHTIVSTPRLMDVSRSCKNQEEKKTDGGVHAKK